MNNKMIIECADNAFLQGDKRGIGTDAKTIRDNARARWFSMLPASKKKQIMRQMLKDGTY